MSTSRARKGGALNKSVFFKTSVLAFVFFGLAAFWYFWVAPQLLKIPKSFSYEAEIVSVDDFFDEEKGDYTGGVFSKTDFTYEVVSTEDGTRLIQNHFTARTPEDELIVSVDHLYGIDAKTGAHVAGFGDRDRDGYLFAPRNLTPGESFTYWHVNYDGPAHMTFVDEEVIYGLRTLHYETDYDGIVVDQTENLGHLPGVGVTRGVELEPYLELWVEPLTGRLIKYRDNTTAYYYDLNTGARLHPWNHFSNTFRESSVSDSVKSARFEKTKMKLLLWYVSILWLVIGTVLLLRSVAMLFGVHFRARVTVLSKLVAIFVILIAGTSLMGWALDIPSLTHITPNTSAMNPLTAVTFILLGFAIFVHKKSGGYADILLGLVVAVIGFARLFETLDLSPYLIDLALFGNKIYMSAVPARMAQYTALSFGLLGLVPFLSRVSILRRLRITEMFLTLVFVTSSLALLNFLFDSAAYINLPIFFSAAIHTAVLFSLLCGVMYVVYRRKEDAVLSVKGWLGISASLLLSVVATIAFASVISFALESEASAEFSAEVDRITRQVETQVTVATSLIQGGEGLLAASETVERHEWVAYVQSLELLDHYPGIQGIGYSVLIHPEDLADHEQQIRDEGYPDYAVFPSGTRDVYSSTIYLEPFDERNQEAFGFDMFQEPVRRTAMEQARDSGNPKMSGRVTLVQEIDDDDAQPGFLMYVPFYQNGQPRSTVGERREHIVGFAYSPFRAHDFFNAALPNINQSDLYVEIRDGITAGRENVLYTGGNARQSFNEAPRFVGSRTIYLYGRPWEIQFESSPTFGETTFAKYASSGAIALGILITVLASIIFYTLAISRGKAVAYADKVTEDLKKTNADLAKSKDEIQKRMEETKRVNNVMIGRELKMIELKKQLAKARQKDDGYEDER